MFKLSFAFLLVAFFVCSCYGRLLAEEPNVGSPTEHRGEYPGKDSDEEDAGDGFVDDVNNNDDGDIEDDVQDELDKPKTESDDLKAKGTNRFSCLFNFSYSIITFFVRVFFFEKRRSIINSILKLNKCGFP